MDGTGYGGSDVPVNRDASLHLGSSRSRFTLLKDALRSRKGSESSYLFHLEQQESRLVCDAGVFAVSRLV